MPSIRSAATTSPTVDSSSPYTLAINMPASITAGDLLVFFVTDYTYRTFSTPSGWTSWGAGSGQGVFSKVAEGSDTVTLTLTGGNTNSSAVCMAIQDWSGTLGDVVRANSFQDAGSGTTRTSPTATATEDGSLLLRAICAQTSAGTTTLGAPSGTTNVGTINVADYKPLVSVRSDDSLVDAGAVGTASWTGLNNAVWSRSFTLIIPPDATAPTISAVTLTGTSKIGQTLTATVTTDQDPVDSTAYQWQKAATDDAEPGTDLSGETSQTLALTYADFGDLLDTAAYVRCQAIATKSSQSSAEVASAWQAVTAPSTTGGVFYRPRIIQL